MVVLTCVRVSLTAVNSYMKIVLTYHFFLITVIRVIVIIVIIVQVNALLETLELTDSAQRGPFHTLQLFGAWPY